MTNQEATAACELAACPDHRRVEISEQAIWIDAGSYALNHYEKRVLRHPHGDPDSWREDKALILRAVLSVYPDAIVKFYRGGVLRFAWNGGEGSGEAFNGAATSGPIDFTG